MKVLRDVHVDESNSISCVRVLHGGLGAFPAGFITGLISSVFPGDHTVVLWETAWAEELLEWATYGRHDLCLAILNNLRFARRGVETDQRMDMALQSLRVLRAVTEAPIIVFSGWEPQRLCSQAKDAGADYFFPLPFSLRTFRAVIKECLAGQ